MLGSRGVLEPNQGGYRNAGTHTLYLSPSVYVCVCVPPYPGALQCAHPLCPIPLPGEQGKQQKRGEDEGLTGV